MSMTITKPSNASKWLFAYDKNLFKISGLNADEELTITIDDWVDTRNADSNGNVEINISSYLQALFTNMGGAESKTTSKTITISFESESGDLDESGYWVIYGCTYEGDDDTPNTSRTDWWVNMPQTYNCLRKYAGGSLYLLDADGGVVGDAITCEDYPIISIDLASVVGDNYGFKDVKTRAGSLPAQVFHYFTRHEETDGLFLRWIDRFGCYQYWLFGLGNDSRASAVYSDQINLPYEIGERQYDGVINQGKTLGRSVSAFARLLTFEQWEFLVGITASPNVCAYNGSEWTPVNVAAVTSAWENDHSKQMQDLEISVVYQDYNTQKL